MLNITGQKNAEGAKAYFSVSDYYAEGQEIIGNWHGKGAVLLGLFGQVDKRQFDQLCDNINPATDKPLTQMTRDGRRVGYDFTWSAPKSISVVHALTGDERIATAFRESINETMVEMESEMHTRVRKGREQHDRPTGNIVWAEFVHLTSRPVNGIPCPQLHVHAFAFNATFDNAEEEWKAGQFGRIKENGYYWQAVQQARFANHLKDLGYSIRKTKDAFEIDGVPTSAIEKFSLRTRMIDQMAEKLGITDPKRKAKLASTTREAKNETIPYSTLVKAWDERLSAQERTALSGLLDHPTHAKPDNARFVGFAAEHLFERQSVVDERRLLTLALRRGCGEVSPEGVRAEAARLDLLKREENGKIWVTTPKVLAEETRMIGFAVAGKATCRPVVDAGEEIRFTEPRLNAGQRRAVETVLRSSDRVMAIIRGAAGSGKTTLTKEAVAQMEKRGKHVVMLAPSAQASRGVLRDEGFSEADTLARFLIDEKMQATAKGGVIWLDESGLVGSKTMTSLFDVAEQLDARVVLAGDKRQMASVERGAALRVLEDVGGLKVAEVTDIRRQSGQYREAVTLLAKGEGAAGLAKLDAMGWVKQMPDVAPYQPISADYLAAAEKGESCLIVCPTHAEGAKITQEIRIALQQSGRLGVEEREFVRLVPLQWTEAERGDMQQYTGDEWLQFHRSAAKFKAGERVRAADAPMAITPETAGYFASYSQARLSLRSGDVIRITANGKTLDGKHKLNNGASYSVRGFSRKGDIELSNGWTIAKDFGHLAHGYCNTAFAAQGRTVDHVLIAQSALSYPASSKEGFYVAASRGRKSATIYTDDKQELRETVERSERRMSATELVRKPTPHLWQKVRDVAARFQRRATLAAKSAMREIGDTVRQKEYAYER